MTTEGHLKPSYKHWMTWGMTCNGRCLTARISAFPRIGNGSSLSDILEDNPDPRYFLSEQSLQYLLRRARANRTAGRGFAARVMVDTGRCVTVEKLTSSRPVGERNR